MSNHLDHWISNGEAGRRQFFGLLQSGLDLLDQGLTVFDHDLRLVAWNQAFFTLLDFPAELAQVGTPFAEFMRHNAQRGEYGPGLVEDLVRERVLAALAFESHQTERVRPNGRIVAVRGEPLPGKGFITVYTDVTVQRGFERMLREQNVALESRVRERTADLIAVNGQLQRAADALRSSEERLRVVTDAIPALIAYCDRDQRYRFVNRGYAQWFDVDKDAVVGRQIREVVGDELHRVIEPHLARVVADGVPADYEYARQRDGRTEHAYSTVLPEFEGGKVIGFFVLSQDITEKKRTQAILAQAQKMEAVGQLTGGVAHDFNNLLTVILGNLTSLSERLPGQPELREYLPAALAAAHKGVELVKRLLVFAKPQFQESACIDVNRAVQGMAVLLRRSLPANIQVVTAQPPQTLHVVADQIELESAFLNLALNARDAMPLGGPLHISSAGVQLDGAQAQALELPAGRYVRISVRDCGCGMDAATVERAFEPFFTTKSFGAGNGLGLSMVYGFVKRSHGSVRIESAVGLGTCVTLWLPQAAEPPAPGPAAVVDAPQLAGEKPLVLLVEDDPDVRVVVRRQVTSLGYPVMEAHNGEDALHLVGEVEQIGIVLSDVVMTGGISGRELVRRARLLRPGLRFVLMTGYEQLANQDEDAGVPVLTKPFSMEHLALGLGGGEAAK